MTRGLNGDFVKREIETTTFDDFGFRTKVVNRTENEDSSKVYLTTLTSTFVHNTDQWRLGQLTDTQTSSSIGKVEILGTTEVERTSTYEENIEGAITGWNNAKVEDGGADHSKFLGRHEGNGGNQALWKTFNIPANSKQITIEFDLLELGHWINDDFKVYINDQEVAKETLVTHMSFPPEVGVPDETPTGSDTHDFSAEIYSGTLGSDPLQKHRFSLTLDQLPAGGTIKIGFGSDNLGWKYKKRVRRPSFGEGIIGGPGQGIGQEGELPGWWGIDNLKIISTYTEQVVNTRLAVNAETTITNKASYTYDADGYLLSQTEEPGHALFHTKTNTLNAYGLIDRVTETWGSTDTDGIAETSRTSSIEYDDKYRYVVKETSPLGHSMTTTWHPVTGVKTSETGPNGLTTTYHHDAFGRQDKATNPDGTFRLDSRVFCEGEVQCPANAVYRTRSASSSGAAKRVYFDKLNRAIQSEILIDGKWAKEVTEYDALGRVVKSSQPHFFGETPQWTTNAYDILDRKRLVTRPDGSTQKAEFDGLTQVSTNELGQKKTVVKNFFGKDAIITNHEDHEIVYSYDSAGRLVKMNANGGITSYTYDLRGFKVSDTDPDKGTWTYRYNALGKIVEQTNAKGEVTRSTYDILDRRLSRTDDATAANPETRTATWVYDTAANGIGKIHKILSPGYNITNTYDDLSRGISTQEQIEGEDLTTSTTYDSQSRPDQITYPSGIVIKNTYDAQGALLKVGKPDGSETWWERKEVDARGNITLALHGNGVETRNTFDPETNRLTNIFSFKGNKVVQDLAFQKDGLGNLTRREDKRQSQVETFVYDNLNRVTTINTTVGGNTNTVTMTYGITGNILSKSDVGTYTYGEVHAACNNGFAGPHAVTTVSGAKNATYCYDANGNMISGDGRITSYTAFDKPYRIARNGNTATFIYGPDRKRYKRIDETVEDGTKTTLYAAGKAFERITDSKGVRTKHYVGDFAVITHKTDDAGSTTSTSYLHRDHLGSVDTITDEAGTVEQRMSFDSWGKRRETNWQSMPAPAITNFNTDITTRGFTGHEMIDAVGLVHMNGRVYEPELGRFLSADPIVESIENLQTYNRYSYVRNNPLTHTDPSGFHTVGAEIGIYTNSVSLFAGLHLSDVAPGNTKGVHNNNNGGLTSADLTSYHSGGLFSATTAGLRNFSSLEPNAGGYDPSKVNYTKVTCAGVCTGIIVISAAWSAYDLYWGVKEVQEGKKTVTELAIEQAPAAAGVFGKGVSKGYKGAKFLLKRNRRTKKRAVKKDNPCNKSFAAGTAVVTPEGSTIIERIKAGDKVLARDKKTGKETFKRVLKTFNNNYTQALSIHLNTDVSKADPIIVTHNHKIFVKNKGWIRADQIVEGDSLSQSGGKWIKVSKIETYHQNLTAYTFEVEDYHTYFVGDQKVWVHNCILSNVPASGKTLLSETTRKGMTKTEILFANRNDAMNWAKQQLGPGTRRTYNKRGQWDGWINPAGKKVYWNHGDWGKGLGKSTFPHLNYDFGGVKGHLFLGDKIKNRGMLGAFSKEFAQ